MATTQKIRYSDCDPQGIVFNANYARYWDDALTDWLEEKGYGGPELGGAGLEIVTARMEMDFKASATLGDSLESEVSVASFGTTSMVVSFQTRRLSDGVEVAVGQEVLVFVDPVDFRPTPASEVIKVDLGGNRQ